MLNTEKYKNIKEEDLIYNIIFDIPKEEKIELSKFIDGMKDCLMALEEINHAIVGSIDNTIQVVSYIEALEAGSFIYKLKDKIKNQSIKDKIKNQSTDIIVAATAAYCGDWSNAVGLLLKNIKDICIEINNDKELKNKEKQKKIYNKVKKELEESGINDELKGYYLNEQKLTKAVKNFAKGVAKTNGNVFWQKDDNSQKLQIDSSLHEENDDSIVETEHSIERIETTTIRIIKPDLEGKSMWQCYWNKRIKCSVEDVNFISKIKNGFKIGNKMRFRVKIKIIEELDENKNIKEGKEKYILLEINEIEEIETPSLF
jgi:hypothetical protein